jgi:FtsZ-interacting cell division protein ZipA
MRRLSKDTLFSATACRERYNAIIEGTARIPTEVDDDPEARRAEMEEFRITREETRNKEKAEKDAQEAAEAKIKNAAKARNAQKAEETASKRAMKETEKAQRAMTRAAQAQIRAARANENRNSKAQRNAQLKKRTQAQEAKKDKNVSPTPTNTKNDTSKTPDPRFYLSLADLKKMCEDRGLNLPRKKDKDSLVQALIDADDEFNQNDLKKMCRSKGLNANVSKLVMKHQLALASAQACGSYESGVAAAATEDDGDDEMDMDED